jgi:hypothetical protein
LSGVRRTGRHLPGSNKFFLAHTKIAGDLRRATVDFDPRFFCDSQLLALSAGFQGFTE